MLVGQVEILPEKGTLFLSGLQHTGWVFSGNSPDVNPVTLKWKRSEVSKREAATRGRALDDPARAAKVPGQFCQLCRCGNYS